jgi:RNA polymerase sigma-70 factor (ECF subfamily)
MALLDLLLTELPARARAILAERSGFAQWLEDAAERARAAAPDVALDDGRFARFLAPKVPVDAPAQFEQLKIEDLYLAAAALERDRAALARIDALCTRVVAREASRARAKGHEDDVRQMVAQLLFLRESGGPPALAQYSGKGELAAWIRVIAVRELLRLKKRSQHALVQDGSEDDALALAAAPASAPELGLLRGHYREAFRAAFREAVDALEGKQRLLLRQHFLDGLSLDALARLHQVHRATIARWLAQAREAIAHHTRERLRAHLAAQPAGLDSVLGLVGSQLEVSLGALLRTLHS